MWKLWKEELYKIASRKILWAGMLLLLLFTGWRLKSETDNYSVTIDGQVYRGQEAIEKDRELTAAYAGILTEDKVQKIYHDFGFFHYDETSGTNAGNFCSRFVTEKMTNYKTDAADSPENIAFYEDDDWERNVAPLLNGTVRFDYTYGWNDFRECFSFLTIIVLFILLITALSPSFSEEYSLKTTGMLLTTRRGKQSGIWMKMAAAFSLASVIYCLFTGFLFLLYLNVFGTQGLDASPVLAGMPQSDYCPDKISGFFLFLFFLGFAGLLLLTGITLAVSALCKNSFLTVVISLALYVLPYVWMQTLAVMVSSFLNDDVIKAISHFMTSMPFYLPMNWGFAFSGQKIALHLAIAFIAGTGCIAAAYFRYRNYQDM